MNETPLESQFSGGAPDEEDVKQCTEGRNSQSENITEAVSPAQALAPAANLDVKEQLTSAPVELDIDESNHETKAGAGEPPVDWFEPLEDDDEAHGWEPPGSDHQYVRRDVEEESLAGESEKSGSVASSEKTFKRVYQLNVHRRKRTHPDEGWVDWPALGDGWRRKEVIRRSGSSVGQKDVYYLSPQGERVRSKVELVSVLEGVKDLSSFEFKAGMFHNGYVPLQRRGKRKMRERSSSESSLMERTERADTPDSHQRLTPNLGPKLTSFNQRSLSPSSVMSTPNRGHQDEEALRESRIKLPHTALWGRPLPSINGNTGAEETSLICAKCGISFIGTWYDKQRKKPCCPNCWAASKTREHPLIRFRKWIPCGQCVACHNTVNCGQCANCKHGLQSPESRKRICRKRKCICPIRKSPGRGNVFQPSPHHIDVPETFEHSMSFQSEFMDSQHPSYQNSDTEDFSVNVDVDDDEDMSTDDDDDWHRKRKRRSCGKCNACLCRKDCGICDFCIDKPKFGGSNKKRQKCRLRQCQRQAMMNWNPESTSSSKHSYDMTYRSHQSSMQVNHMDTGQRNGHPDRVPSISNHATSQLDQQSRWAIDRLKTNRGVAKHTGEVADEELPMITQIFSLAENQAGSGLDMDNQLFKLLEALRSSALPILWYAIMVEGPQLQLTQCAKQSSMTDTIVLIDPGFCYQVTVQKQPLLLTHPLYDDHPAHLTSATEVVNLLLDLERYRMCQGLPSKELPSSNTGPVILERASTCDFLVKKNVAICTHCKALCGQLED
ncbi:methyl-CpG-binding domain protein 1b isoform 2-T2 [Polymixia lowei]